LDAQTIIFEFTVCTAATVFFSLLMNAPPKTVPVSALVGGTSWIIYKLILAFGQPEFLAYFFGALLVAVSAEVFARLFKMPAPIFIFPALIPVVPGTRLYKTALALVEQRYTEFRDEATRTLFAFCAITVALALTSVVARSVSAYISERNRRQRQKEKNG